MHTLVRKIHFVTAFFLLAFVVMYFVTGYVVTRETWFPDGEKRTETRMVSVPPEDVPNDQISAAALAARIQQLAGTAGKRFPARTNAAGRLAFDYLRPGYYAAVEIVSNDPQDYRLEVNETFQDWKRTAINYHRLHGYGGGWFYSLWALIYDLASLAMIVFAVTGVLLWYRLSKRRLAGWLVLAAGGGLTVSTVVYYLLAH
jgi:hypothetical protein